jgi:hemerythrin-like domain-containing protein
MDIIGQGRAAPSAGFEVPLEMLAACHGRVQAQCELLQRLLDHLPAHGADRQALEAIERIRRYFDTAARDHHADEEQDLLPALLEAMAGSDAVCIRDMMRRVRDEHRMLEQRWAALREALQALESGASQELDAGLAQGFIEAYRAHMAFEEAELLPMAQRLLGDDQLDAIGRAMRLRRGIADPA